MNKYEMWYNNITLRGKQNRNLAYSESHHIVPKSLGGNDILSNKTILTAREHFICHWLLTKIVTGADKYKMLSALHLMQGTNKYQERYHTKITSRAFAYIREEYAKYISEMNTGRIQPAEEKEKQIAAMTGRKREPFSKEWLDNLSKAKSGANNNRYGVEVTKETRAKQREKALGRKQSVETIKKKADAVRGSKREKKLCPHCNKEVAVNGYARWHGNNCKRK